MWIRPSNYSGCIRIRRSRRFDYFTCANTEEIERTELDESPLGVEASEPPLPPGSKRIAATLRRTSAERPHENDMHVPDGLSRPPSEVSASGNIVLQETASADRQVLASENITDDTNELGADLSDVMLESPEASINFTPFINQDLGDEQPLSHEQCAGLLVHARKQVNGPSVAVLDVQQTEIQVHRSLPLEDRYKEATEGEGKPLAHQTPKEHKILECLRCSKCHEMPKGNLVYITAKKVENARYQLEGQAHFCSEECALLGMHSDENIVKLCLLQEGCPKPCCVCLDEDCIWIPLTSCSGCGHYICAPCCVIYTRRQGWRCVVKCEGTTHHKLMPPESLIGPMNMKVHTFDDTVCVESESSDELPLELEGDIWPGFDEIPLTPPPSAEEQFRQHRQNELERENQMLEFHNSLTDLSYENTGISGPGNMEPNAIDNSSSTACGRFVHDPSLDLATPSNPPDVASLQMDEGTEQIRDDSGDAIEVNQQDDDTRANQDDDIVHHAENPGNTDLANPDDDGFEDDEGNEDN